MTNHNPLAPSAGDHDWMDPKAAKRVIDGISKVG